MFRRSCMALLRNSPRSAFSTWTQLSEDYAVDPRTLERLWHHVRRRSHGQAGADASPFVGDRSLRLNGIEERRIRALLARAEAGEPYPYLVGKIGFYEREFAVRSGHCLIPRPDSEALIEVVRKHFERCEQSSRAAEQQRRCSWSVYECGVGSGCLLVTVLADLLGVSDAASKVHRLMHSGVGIDVSPDALRIARANCIRHAVGGATALLQADVLSLSPSAAALQMQNALPRVSATVDSATSRRILISNPPYVESEFLAANRGDGAGVAEAPGCTQQLHHYEPLAALDGSETGLRFYGPLFRLAEALRCHAVAFEVGAGQAGDVRTLARERGWVWVESEWDLLGHERALLFSSEECG